MKESKHTPGPWQLVTPPDAWPYVADATGEFNLAKVDTSLGRGKLKNYNEASANARLIACAPDLLALVSEKAGADCLCQSHDTCWHCRARAALSKARGLS